MSDKPLLSFRSIAAPLDVDDAALDAINAKLGVPTMTRPAAPKASVISERPVPAAAAAPAPSPARAPAEKLTIEIPDYLGHAIRQAAVADRKTARHVVMEALKTAGFSIADADLVPDGRRSRGRP